MLFGNCVFAVAMSQSDTLAGSLAEVIQFCTPRFSASDRLDINDVRRMKQEYTLHTLVIYDTPHSEGLIDAAPFAGDYHAGEYLKTLFVAFLDSAPYVYGIAYFKMRYVLLETFTFSSVQQFCFHFIFFRIIYYFLFPIVSWFRFLISFTMITKK